MIQHGLLVRLDVAHGKDGDVAALLQSAAALLPGEPGTQAWYALRFGRGEYGIFDAFADEAARDAHLNGRIAQALGAAGHLFDSPPVIEKVRVLAHKLPLATETAHKALLLAFPAKSGQADAVEQFLRDARALVDDEPGTIAWFAIQRANGDYGIFDVFPDNGSRFAHLSGHLPRELAKHALSLLGGMPDLHMLDVLAERAVMVEATQPVAAIDALTGPVTPGDMPAPAM